MSRRSTSSSATRPRPLPSSVAAATRSGAFLAGRNPALSPAGAPGPVVLPRENPVVSEGRPIAVVGGGMLGLTLAHRLRRQGRPVALYEAAPTLGGLAGAW